MKSFGDYALELDIWYTPATDYPEEQVGNFRIHHSKYSRGYYQMWGVKDYLLFRAKKPLPITLLQEKRGVKWHQWMIDDPPQWYAMQYYAEHSEGAVLTTGLGLGLIIFELVKNPSVTDITVVELNQHVIDLVSKYLPPDPRIHLVVGDFYDFIEVDSRQWDSIILDLWVAHGKEQKMDALYHGVLPLIPILKFRYPNASITFHGFQTVSDIKPISDRMVELVVGTNR